MDCRLGNGTVDCEGNGTVDCEWGMGLWTWSGEWDCGLGNGIRDWDWGTGLWTVSGEWERGVGNGTGNGTVYWDCRMELGNGTVDWGMGLWTGRRVRGNDHVLTRGTRDSIHIRA